jgi:hypothetical protein
MKLAQGSWHLIRRLFMPTYYDYLQYAKAKGFIPFTEKTFNAFIKAKINPVTSTLIGD